MCMDVHRFVYKATRLLPLDSFALRYPAHFVRYLLATPPSEMSTVATYKVVLLGGAAVGKTHLTKRWMEQPTNTIERYAPTLGVEVHPIVVHTKNHGVHCINVWDTAGDKRFGGIWSAYPVMADGAIVYLPDDREYSYEAEFDRVAGANRPKVYVTRQSLREDGEWMCLQQLLRQLPCRECGLEGHSSLEIILPEGNPLPTWQDIENDV